MKTPLTSLNKSNRPPLQATAFILRMAVLCMLSGLASALATPGELITNGSFASFDGWTTSFTSGASGTLTNSAGKALVTITDGGSHKANVQLKQTFYGDLMANIPHAIYFEANASETKAIDVIVYSESGSVLWAKYNLSIGTTTDSYTYSFTPSSNEAGAYLAFRLGGSDSNFAIDNVSVAPSEKLTWAPPALVDPVTINLGENDWLSTLSSGQDYIINLPTTVTRKRRVQIEGGRNVVVIGGQIEISNVDNAFIIKSGDYGRVVHIEGVLISHESSIAQGDAFGISAPTSIIQIQNARVEHLQGYLDTESGGVHSDVIQTWGGSLEVRVDRLSGSSNYQGLFLVANYNTNNKFTFKRMDISLDPEWFAGAGGGGVVWLDRGLSGGMGGPFPNEFVNFYGQPRSGTPLDLAVYPARNHSDPDQQASMTDGYLTWPGLSWVTGGLYEGTPPGGDFVPSGTAGLNYSSPGYIGELLFENEDVSTISASDTVTVFYEGGASGGAADKLNANAVGDYITYTLPDIPAGDYQVLARVKKFTSRGQFQLDIDGIDQGAIQDEYYNGTAYDAFYLGSRTFTSTGDRDFTFTVTGKNASSPGYSLTFDYIYLCPYDTSTIRYEAESLATPGASDSITNFTESQSSNGEAEKLNADASGDYITYTLPDVPAGQYTIKIGTKTMNTRGKFQLAIDGVDFGTEQDQYSASITYQELSIGTKTFTTSGDKDVTLTVTGKNAASSGYGLVVDYIELEP